MPVGGCLLLLAGLLVHSVAVAALPIITSSQDERITLKIGNVEIVVPIPAGYELADYKTIPLGSLPVLQERRMVALFRRTINASNVYQVKPGEDKSEPLYYLIYVPKLTASGHGDDPLTQLEARLFEHGAEIVGESQRYALQRTDANTLSVTWADLSQYAVSANAGLKAGSVNCINTVAYLKATALLMFDTLEACGLNAQRVKSHGEAWAKQIKQANEPPSYVQQLLSEKGIDDVTDLASNEQAEETTGKASKEVATGTAPAKPHTGQEAGTNEARPYSRFLWLIAGAFAGITCWLLISYVIRRYQPSVQGGSRG